ncbi:MAG: carbohydrate ABC transporter substrate-binding protein [Opitutaceae bacterium]|nr:carbohydrate ABC transporter substrate-binding protein [Opitutaceae bacterium]
MNSRVRRWWGWLLFAAAYVFAVYWVFTRSTPLGGQREVTIRFAHWQIELGPPEGLDAVIKRYEELNPRVRVKQIKVPSAVYIQWMRTNFAGDSAPDLVEYGSWLPGLADLPVRYFEPLTNELLEPNPYNRGTPLEGVPWLKTFADELLDQRMYSPEPGQYYAVTLTRGSYRLFTNRKLYQGITGSTEPPKDFAALRRVFEQTADYARRRDRPLFPFAGSNDNAIWLMGFYMNGVMSKYSLGLDRTGILSLNSRQVLWDY